MNPTKKNNKLPAFKNPSHLLELIMAIIVFITIIIAIFALWEPFLHYLSHRTEHGAFLNFIGEVFGVVIGIEFFKLLCNPGKDTLLEVLMFVVARHMIIEKTSPTENLISIITILILFIADRYFLANPHFSHYPGDNGKNDKPADDE